jgi:prepilin-type N-terminal cleavage/methylation domain-containing protein
MKRRNRIAGFTLAEMLVAATLLSIVMTTVYVLFHSVIGSWRAVEHDFDAYRDARDALSMMQRELQNAMNGAGFLFEGKDDEFTFFAVSEPMNVVEEPGRHLIKIRYHFNRAQKELIREEAMVMTALPDVPPEGKPPNHERIRLKNKEKFILAKGVEKFGIRYEWIPRPKTRDPLEPPEVIEPIFTERHEPIWRLGYPNGIEITCELADPKEKKKENKRGFAFTEIIPIRTSTSWLLEDELTKAMNSKL